LEIERGARSPDPWDFGAEPAGAMMPDASHFASPPSWVASIHRIRQVYVRIRILAHSD
jgi:hypothetical protein